MSADRTGLSAFRVGKRPGLTGSGSAGRKCLSGRGKRSYLERFGISLPALEIMG